MVKLNYPKGYKKCNPEFKKIKGSNNLYLFLHSRLINYCDPEGMISRKDLMFCTSRYFRFKLGLLGLVIREDMIQHNLLKRINRDKYQVINLQKSEHIKQLFL